MIWICFVYMYESESYSVEGDNTLYSHKDLRDLQSSTLFPFARYSDGTRASRRSRKSALSEIGENKLVSARAYFNRSPRDEDVTFNAFQFLRFSGRELPLHH